MGGRNISLATDTNLFLCNRIKVPDSACYCRHKLSDMLAMWSIALQGLARTADGHHCNVTYWLHTMKECMISDCACMYITTGHVSTDA